MGYLKPLFLLWPIQMHPLLVTHPLLISLMETGLVDAMDQGSVFGTVPQLQLQMQERACITHIFGVVHCLCFELE